MSWSHTTEGDILESYDRVVVSQTTQISQIFYFIRSLLLLGTKTIGSMSLRLTITGDILESYDRVVVSQTTQISQIFYFIRSLLLLGIKTIGSMSWSHTTKGDILDSYDRVVVSQNTQISQIFMEEVCWCKSDKGLWRRLENSHLIVFDLLEMQAYLQS